MFPFQPEMVNSHQPELAEGLELFSKHKYGCLFLLLCFPSQQEKLEKVGGKRPLDSGGSGVPADEAVGRDARRGR